MIFIKGILNRTFEYFQKTDKLMFTLCLAASSYGILLIYSATHAQGLKHTLVQALALILGLVAAVIISIIDYEELSKFWPFIVGISVILMILTFFIGVGPTGSNNKAWLMLPGGLSFQPSEVLKFAFILTFARHIEHIKDVINKPFNVLALCIHAAIPILLVMATKDDGSATVFLAIFVCMMIASGLKLRYFAIGGALSAAAAPLVWFLYFDNFQRERFLVVFNPSKYDPTGLGKFYQQGQGLIAIGSGQLSGRGFLEGPRTQHGMVPKNYNDFILTVAAEELGFLGAMVIFILLVAIFIRIIIVGKRSNLKMGTLVCIGIFAQLSFQSILNIGMCLGLLPVIGVTLPFFSAGGSSMFTLFLSIGLVLSIYIHNEKRIKLNSGFR